MALGTPELLVILIILVVGVGGLVLTIFGLVRSAQRSEWGWFAAIVVGLVLGIIGPVIAGVYLLLRRGQDTSVAVPASGPPGPGWYDDPDGTHEHRYWDGTVWTDQVSNQGVTSTSPLGER